MHYHDFYACAIEMLSAYSDRNIENSLGFFFAFTNPNSFLYNPRNSQGVYLAQDNIPLQFIFTIHIHKGILQLSETFLNFSSFCQSISFLLMQIAG